MGSVGKRCTELVALDGGGRFAEVGAGGGRSSSSSGAENSRRNSCYSITRTLVATNRHGIPKEESRTLAS